jgi:hypothetical protein
VRVRSGSWRSKPRRSAYQEDSRGNFPDWNDLVIVEFSADKIDDIKSGVYSVEGVDKQS